MADNRLYSTREAAEHLNVHVRTVRKWIDAFTDYVEPQLNSRGHYQLTPAGLRALKNVQAHLKEGNKSFKQVREELVARGDLAPAPPKWAATDLSRQLNTLELSLERTLHLLEHLQMTAEEVRKKQDQLKFEIRDVTFAQRLQAADERKAKRKKAGLPRLSQLFR